MQRDRSTLRAARKQEFQQPAPEKALPPKSASLRSLLSRERLAPPAELLLGQASVHSLPKTAAAAAAADWSRSALMAGQNEACSWNRNWPFDFREENGAGGATSRDPL